MAPPHSGGRERFIMHSRLSSRSVSARANLRNPTDDGHLPWSGFVGPPFPTRVAAGGLMQQADRSDSSASVAVQVIDGLFSSPARAHHADQFYQSEDVLFDV